MSNIDYSRYIDPAAVPRMTKDQVKMSLDDYPPPLERLLGTWKPLAGKPFTGITTDGTPVAGLFDATPHGAPCSAAAEAATRWLDLLPPDTRAKVCAPVDSDLWRYWHNTPLILRPSQVELLELPLPLREVAMDVVRASLSQEGFSRTRTVMENNLFLGRLIDLTELLNDWSFTLTIFGEPSTVEPWGWQFFGHHLALNCLFIGEHMTLSPVFMGLEPDHDHGPNHRRMFEPHEQAALRMMGALSDQERIRAVLYDSMLTADQPDGRYHPDDGRHVGGAFQDNRIVPYEGVPVAALGREQRLRLMELASLFMLNMPEGPSQASMGEFERYLDQTHFAWIGKADEINPFYFRIHSPVALFEFDHHSGIFLANEEPQRFHVHSVIRTPNGEDYGMDLLKKHYAAGGHGHAHPGGHHHGGAHSHDGGHTFHTHD
ncbi:DUF3500 domain-containing protein [Croceicoccus bisphenolivorans]|uniref:DUF3500 domain-containing protein n=1 Tax=Croceicoccus bisphenolivorans TaxID=1783232 RepID=UPI00082F2021|nr:DUF3500 domain-containing protein [Croceicoccus bisphenolivorans]